MMYLLWGQHPNFEKGQQMKLARAKTRHGLGYATTLREKQGFQKLKVKPVEGQKS